LAPSRPGDSAARVRLTPLEETDLPVLFEWINNRALVELSSAFAPVSAAEHRRWFEAIRQRHDAHVFAIRRLDSPAPIGTCQLHDVHPVHRSAELQIRIGDASSRGQGLGTEAVRLLVEYGFGTLRLHRIALHVFATNLAAQRAYEKAGFVREGVLKDAAFVGGHFVDSVVMAILNV
jgi:RimJ/RimL family protein N-acetyltransferase